MLVCSIVFFRVAVRSGLLSFPVDDFQLFLSSRTGARPSGAEAPRPPRPPRSPRSLMMNFLRVRCPHSRAGPGIPFRHGGRQKPGSSRSGSSRWISSRLGSCRPGCSCAGSSRSGSRPHGSRRRRRTGRRFPGRTSTVCGSGPAGRRRRSFRRRAGPDRSRRRQSLRYIFHRRFRSLRPQAGSVFRQLTCLRAGIGSGLRFGFPIAFCSSFAAARFSGMMLLASPLPAGFPLSQGEWEF